MTEFRLIADATLEAENLDDAFFKLATYFTDLSNEEEADSPFIGGQIELKPLEDG